MGKGIFGFCKWLWRGKLFVDDMPINKPAPISPREFAKTVSEPMNPPYVHASWNKAVEVKDKIAERVIGKTWLTCVGVEKDEKYGHVVFIGMNPEVLQLKPEELEYFVFTQEVDGVQVRLMPISVAKALAGLGIRPQDR